MPTPPEEAQDKDINFATPGTPPQVEGKQRSRLSIGLIAALVLLIVVLAAYAINTAIPNGGGSP